MNFEKEAFKKREKKPFYNEIFTNHRHTQCSSSGYRARDIFYYFSFLFNIATAPISELNVHINARDHFFPIVDYISPGMPEKKILRKCESFQSLYGKSVVLLDSINGCRRYLRQSKKEFFSSADDSQIIHETPRLAAK